MIHYNGVDSQNIENALNAKLGYPDLFVSDLLTGTGAEQSISHNFAIIPTSVFVFVQDFTGAYTVTEGTHTSSVIKVTVTAGVTYKILSLFHIVGSATIPGILGPMAVPLLTAANYRILTKSGISTTAGTSITGDIAVSPIAATAITGFGLVLDGSGTFSTSSLVTGNVYAADYTAPTPANLTQAVLDMQAAYTNAASRTLPLATNLNGGNLGGLVLVPGLYKWTSNVTIPTDLTLAGGPGDTWIMQISGTLDLASATEIILTGGALPQNVFWQVAGAVTLFPTSVFRGIILAATNVAVQNGAVVHGRILAQTAATLISNTISA